MSIRRILLLALLFFAIAAAAAMSLLAYTQARSALRDEIRQHLATQSATLIDQVGSLLFERVEDIHGWSRLELMQEVRVGDVDKRLAHFLSEIKQAYAGIYTQLFCVYKGRVVASSDSARIGHVWDPQAVWLSLGIQSARVILDHPVKEAGRWYLYLHTALTDVFSGQPMGEIYASVDREILRNLLQRAVADSHESAILLDGDDRVLAFAGGAAEILNGLSGSLADWQLPAGGRGVIARDDPLMGKVLIGYSSAVSYTGLPDFGWKVLMINPERIAFAPVRHLLWEMIAVLMLITGIAVLLARRLSGLIARPIQRLTAVTRQMQDETDSMPPLLPGRGEVAELSRAFRHLFDELKKSRQHLVRVSKLAAVGEMSAMLAHEVRNPLGILRSSAQLLRRQPGLDARGHEMLDYMLNECDRINNLVTGLLETARPRQPEYAPQRLGGLLAQVIDMSRAAADKKGIHIEYESFVAEDVLACDREQILQVLLNLILNAIQVLDEGGMVRVELRGGQGDLQIDVADNGPGIPPAEREHILEPFVSHRAGGIGLGLAVVQEIVQAHHGSMSIDSSPLGGALFRIRLPRTREYKPT